MEAGERVVGVNGSADERQHAGELLQVRGVFKSFGGTEALADVGMTLKAGEILALLGENGAGKSTLIKILAGVYTLDAGSVSFRGVEVTHALRRLPIAFIHQDLGLIDWMTVAENICMTLGFPRRLGMIDQDAARRRAAAALDALGADIDPDTRIQNLSRTEKSLVAIARALAAEPEILVLDEPTASLPADEVARLFAALRRLRARGVAMIYVSHRLDEVFEIADRMVVLRDGRVAGEREVAKTTPDETILLIVGREPSQVFRRPPERHGSPRLALQSVMVEEVGPDRLRDPFRRDRRPRRAARRGPGKRRAGAVRGLADDRRTRSARRTPCGRLVAARGDGARRQSRLRRPGRRIDHAEFVGAREPVPQSGRGRFELVFVPLARPREPRREGARRSGRIAAERSDAADRVLVGRQPTEGGGRALAAS